MLLYLVGTGKEPKSVFRGVAAAAGSSDEYFSMALAVRKMVTGKRARRESMLNGSPFQVISIPLKSLLAKCVTV